MEGELFNTIQKPESAPVAPQFAKQFPEISFIPSDLKGSDSFFVKRTSEKCATASIMFGAVAFMTWWWVILIGIVASAAGIVLSVLGIKSARVTHARIGLGLSLVGLVASLWYAIAAWNGVVNYNYFTSDFWGTSTVASVK